MRKHFAPGEKPIDRCGPTGRARYKSKGAARNALASAIHDQRHAEDPRTRARRRERRFYACIHCGGYHLTSQPVDRVPLDDERRP